MRLTTSPHELYNVVQVIGKYTSKAYVSGLLSCEKHLYVVAA